MQRTNQSYAKSSQTAKHEKKIEIKCKREQLKQGSGTNIIKFLNRDFERKPPKEM